MICHNRMFEGFVAASGHHPFAALGRAVLEIADERRVAGGAVAPV
jgi:hypothetical protein